MRVLVVAGLDPSGGAGLTADLEAVRGAGAEGWAVASAITAQGPAGVKAVAPVPADLLLAQIDALVAGKGRQRARVGAVKTGMLATAELVQALAGRLSEAPLARTPLVVDPVLLATSGEPLFDPGPASLQACLAPLLSRAALVTPNLAELEALTSRVISEDADAVAAARELPCRAVLVKGGHRRGAPVDLLVTADGVERFEGKRRPGTARGTGCRLASAIAAHLALGESLPTAVRKAKRLVERYLDRAVTTG
jgi:hydroxymethylpyrimidine/phosphomethylpyrimidine kinase